MIPLVGEVGGSPGLSLFQVCCGTGTGELKILEEIAVC